MSRIIVLIPSYRGGGAEVISLELLKYLNARNDRIIAICFFANGSYKEEFTRYNIDEYFEPKMYRWPLILHKYSLCSEDVVISMIRSTTLVLFPFVLRVKRVICREANTLDNLDKMNLLKRKLYIALLRRVYSSRNVKLIFNSALTRKSFSTFSVHRSTTIPNPLRVNIQEFLQREKSGKSTRIVHFGRFHTQKNHEFIIDLAIELKRISSTFTVDLYGEGELRSTYVDRINHLSLDDIVKVNDFEPNIASELTNYDILLLPSHYEGFGNVVIEALACGLSVITSEYVGATGFIDHPKLTALPLNINMWCKQINNYAFSTFTVVEENALREALDNFRMETIFARYLE